MRIHASLLACVLLVMTTAPQVWAQNPIAVSGAQSLFIDTSVRSSGMGRSTNAVFWGESANDWSNPALLAFRKGIQYEYARTQLVPDLADDVYFTTKKTYLGYWGVGVLAAGRPFQSVGGVRLDYGVSFATDPDGNILGTFSSYEDTRIFGVGVNVMEFAGHVLDAAGLGTPELSRFGDVALGWNEKKTHVSMSPAFPSQGFPEAAGDVTTHDSGVLVRLTPYDGIDHDGLLPALDQVAGLRLDASYGGSTQNYNNATIAYIDQGQSDPVARVQIKGWAVHAALDLPRARREEIRSGRLGWLIDLVSPLVSAGRVGSREIPMVPDEVNGGLRSGTRIEHSGWEVTFANIYSIRGGKIDDPVGTIQGHTKGWGIGLRLGDAAGFSYDRATVPQAAFLDRVHRKSLTFRIDPIRVSELIRGDQTRGTW